MKESKCAVILKPTSRAKTNNCSSLDCSTSVFRLQGTACWLFNEGIDSPDETVLFVTRLLFGLIWKMKHMTAGYPAE